MMSVDQARPVETHKKTYVKIRDQKDRPNGIEGGGARHGGGGEVK